MTLIAGGHDEKIGETLDDTRIASPARRTNVGSADQIFASATSNATWVMPATRERAMPKNVVRSSLIGLAAATSIFAGGVTSPAAAETTTNISPARRTNEVRQSTWWESTREKLQDASAKRGGGAVSDSAALAADDLKDWLALSDSDVANLCGFSRRTLLNWRTGASAPHGNSSRRLFAIHALIGHLLDSAGPDRTRLWLEMDDGTGLSRLDALGAGDEGVRRVLTQAEPLLFSFMPPRENFDSGLTDAEAARIAISARGEAVPPGTIPIRRVRRP